MAKLERCKVNLERLPEVNSTIAEAIYTAGIHRIKFVRLATDAELEAIEGLDAAKVATIRVWLENN